MDIESCLWCGLTWMTDHLHPTPLLSTPLSFPHLPPSLISPSSVLSYHAVLLSSRGGLCWRSSEELSCAVCFFSPSSPHFRSPGEKETREEGAGGEGGKLSSQRGLGERQANKDMWWRGEWDTLNFQQQQKKIRQKGQMDKGADRRKTNILHIHQRFWPKLWHTFAI